MRLLHTSDWHLGQTLHDFDRDYEHRRFLDWLLDTLEAEAADALLIAGDVFDQANPSAASQALWYGFLKRAHARLPQLQVVAVAGNHDSGARLEAPGPLLEAFEVTVLGQPRRGAEGRIAVEELVRPLRDASGAVAAWVLAVPFLRPGDLPRVEGAADPYLEGIAALYRAALEHAQTLRQPGQALVAMGHCHVAGGQTSADSERRILIGGAEALPARVFDPRLDYVALGHLHLAQKVGGAEHVRYSGSPLPLSFSEIGYTHQVLRVDLAPEAPAVVTPLPVPRAVALLRVPPKPAPAEEALAALAALELADAPLEARPLLQVRVRLDLPDPGLRARVEAALGDKPVRLARIETTSGRREAAAGGVDASLDELERLEPETVFRELLARRLEEGADREELLAAFHELLLTEDAA